MEFYDDLKVGKVGEFVAAQALKRHGWHIDDISNGERKKEGDFEITRGDKKYIVEIKYVSAPESSYRTFPIEMITNIGYQSLGWYYTTKADWIIYVSQQSKHLYIVWMDDIRRIIDNYPIKISWQDEGDHRKQVAMKYIPIKDIYFDLI